jgi:YD repeat-containing protein
MAAGRDHRAERHAYREVVMPRPVCRIPGQWRREKRCAPAVAAAGQARLRCLAGLACWLLAGTAAQAQTDPRAMAAENGGGGAATVDPFSQVLQFSIPLGSVPGRGGQSVPIGLRYTSRVWSAEINIADSQGGAGFRRALFRTDTGWTPLSSCASFDPLGALTTLNLPFDPATGQPFNPFRDTSSPRVFVNRELRVLPSGATREFRTSDRTDGVRDAEATPSRAVDGTGSILFREADPASGSEAAAQRDASGRQIGGRACDIDANGNAITMAFTDSGERVVQSLGRSVPVPVQPVYIADLTGGRANVEAAPGDYPVELPRVGGGTARYTIKIQRLADVRMNAGDPLRFRTQAVFNPATNSCRVLPSGFLFSSPAGCAAGRFISRDELFNPPLIGEIVLPNSTRYTFRYNVFGEVTRIVFPTGAVQEFEYAQLPPRTGNNQPDQAFLNQTNRGVVRTTLKIPGQPDAVTQYAPDVVRNPDGSRIETRYTQTANELIAFGFDDPRAGAAVEQRYFAPPPAGQPDSAAPLLRRTLTEFAVDGSRDAGPVVNGRPSFIYRMRNVRPVRVTEISFDGTGDALALTRTTEYAPRTDVVLVTAVNQHDFVRIARGSAATVALAGIPIGARLRRTETEYLNDCPSGPYCSRNILNLATSVRVIDAAGRQLSETQIVYDDQPIRNYGSNGQPLATIGWIDPQSQARGNPTRIRACKRQTPTAARCSLAGGDFDEVVQQFDQFGNLVAVTDARGNRGTTDYAAALAYAFATRTLTPTPRDRTAADVGTPASTVPLATTTEYDFATGLPTAIIGPNGHDLSNNVIAGQNRRTLQYDDPLNRVTRVTEPDGNFTEYAYFDGDPNNLFTRTTSPIDATRTVFTDIATDAVGRPRQMLIYGTNTGEPIARFTQYDALGRVARRSDAYLQSAFFDPPGCTFGNPGCVIRTDRVPATALAYDAVGRVVRVTNADGAVSSIAYGTRVENVRNPDGSTTATTFGPTITVTDAAGARREMEIDAFGNGVRVREFVRGADRNAETEYLTEYAYDALENLREVRQGVQRRHFAYDARGRMIRVALPEHQINPALALADPITGNAGWTESFEYDQNGSLLARTDARGITQNFAYDRLNRLTLTSFSDGVTPSVTRSYDEGCFGLTLANARGRLGCEVVRTGVEQRTPAATLITGYDAAGRVTELIRDFRDDDGRGALRQYKVQQSYNLAGAVTSKTLPSGRTQSFTYDGYGRLASTAGTLGPGVQGPLQSTVYATGIAYDAAGRLLNEQFGTARPVFLQRRYTAQGQNCQVNLGSTPNGREFGALFTIYGGFQREDVCTTGSDNNGNVFASSQNILEPGVGNIGYAQFYNYDGLNRLTRVEDRTFDPRRSGNQSVLNFTRTYSYDRYGNRSVGLDDIRAPTRQAEQIKRDVLLAHASTPLGAPPMVAADALMSPMLPMPSLPEPNATTGAR